MANTLQYNVEAMRKQARDIERLKKRLQEDKRNLTQHLGTLRTSWVSDASTQFFNKYDTNWVGYIDKYCAMLQEVSTELSWAADQYEMLSDEYKQIQIDL